MGQQSCSICYEANPQTGFQEKMWIVSSINFAKVKVSHAQDKIKQQIKAILKQYDITLKEQENVLYEKISRNNENRQRALSPIYFLGKFDKNNVMAQDDKAVLYCHEQALYYGPFINGIPEGQKGVLIREKTKQQFQGSFKSGFPNGEGEYTNFKKRIKFVGTWIKHKDKMMSIPTKGSLIFTSGDQQIQKIIFESVQHKYCTIQYASGARYTGFIDQNKLVPNSNGKMIFSTNDTYQGQWLDGRFQGTGIYKWKTGETYKGQYLKGLRHGEGCFTYEDGFQLKAIWKQGKLHGPSKLMDENGFIKEKAVYNENHKVQSSL